MENVQLQATCAALGYLEGDLYQKEPDCLETVKDLIRFLKREDESCDIRRQLGHSQILQRDLLPIIKQYNGNEDRLLLETALRLMVNLTQPAKLCFQNHIPEDKTTRNYFLEVESHLQAYKEAFIDEALFAVLTKKLGDLLQLDWENRQEEDRLLIERILILLRNILHIPPNLTREQRTDDDASVHDQVLWALHISGMEDLLLYLASSEDERGFAFHVLEIISLMFREQTPEQLAHAGGRRSLTEKERDERELAMKREQEQAERRAAKMRQSTRHSRFGGTFTVKNLKSISDREVIYHSSLGKVKDITFDQNKKLRKLPKNRQAITERNLTRRSTLSIRLFLKEFCIQFLENCYNPLMASIKESLLHSKAQENDETYYLWAMRFFMEFNRHYNFRVELISETLSIPTFHYIQTHLQNFHEMILTSKKEAIVWSRRMHLALKAYHELLQSLNLMDRSTDKTLCEGAKVMKCNIFYVMEYREIFVILLKKFDETRQSRAFLKDLVETTHLFLRMIENFTKSNHHLVVLRKKRKIKRKKHSKGNHANTTQQLTEQQLEDLWDDVSSDLSAIFQGRLALPQDVTPFDAASEVSADEQRANTMYKIQMALREKQPAGAVALFRAAREVWPEKDEFGSTDISPEDEFVALREIFFASLSGATLESNVTESEDETQDDIYAEEFEQEQEAGHVYAEEEFIFKDFLKRFCQPQIVKAYITLLANFKNNSQHANHCILKMLHRIGFDMGVIGMLFQASLFRIFQRILSDPVCNMKHFEELQVFAKHIIRKFIEVAQKNPKVYVELFFWSTLKESVDIVEGYGTYTSHNAKKMWTEEQDDELRQLYEQFKDNHDDGMDVVDHIMIHIIDQTKSRRQIIRELVHLDLIESAKELKKQSTEGKRHYVREWREEDELELRELYEEHKASLDPLGNIISNMQHPRPKHRVIDKLLEIGVVSDKKQLYKRRASKKQKKNTDTGSGLIHTGGAMTVEKGMEDYQEKMGNNNYKNLPSDETDARATSDDDSEEDQDDDDDDAPAYIKHIKHAVKKAYEKGLEAAVGWLRNCLHHTADDKEEDEEGGDTGDDSVPIVPVLEEQEDAMETVTFKHLLNKCGVKPPANEQERFWRIPAYLKAADLRSRAKALEKCTKQDGGRTTKRSAERAQILKALVKQKKQSLGERRKNNIVKRRQLTSRPAEDAQIIDDQRNDIQEEISQQMTGQSELESGQNHGESIKSSVESQSRDQARHSYEEVNLSPDKFNQSDETSSSSPTHAVRSQQEEPVANQTSPQPMNSKRKRLRVQRSLDSDSEYSADEDRLTIVEEDAMIDNVQSKHKVSSKPNKRARLLMDSDSDSEKENVTSKKQKAKNEFETMSVDVQSTSDLSDVEVQPVINHKNKRVALASDSDE